MHGRRGGVTWASVCIYIYIYTYYKEGQIEDMGVFDHFVFIHLSVAGFTWYEPIIFQGYETWYETAGRDRTG